MKQNKKHKISFCTICMNRLYHLKETLPKNIEDNINYENIEFVVLNYNSKDDLDCWMKSEMAEYINSGVVKYYRTIEPNTFQRSHAKNVVSKQATGDIICNVDADNFIGFGFAEYINNAFNINPSIYMAVDKKNTMRDCHGRICLLKEDFLTLEGYDESMSGYGFEDYDLWNRLELLGRKVHYINNTGFLNALTHDDIERLENESNTQSIEKVYVKYIDHAVLELLYLFNNYKFFKGKIIENRLLNSESIDNLFEENRNSEYTYNLINNTWISGEWLSKIHGIELIINKTNIVQLKLGKNKKLETINTFNVEEFHEITSEEETEEMIMFFSQINNRVKMEKNKELLMIAPNKSHFGETTFV